jgi:hypothetical protein
MNTSGKQREITLPALQEELPQIPVLSLEQKLTISQIVIKILNLQAQATDINQQLKDQTTRFQNELEAIRKELGVDVSKYALDIDTLTFKAIQ